MKVSLSLLFTIIVSLIILLLLIAGLSGQSIDFQALENALSDIRESRFALFIVIGIFIFASFLGAPQWALITACVVGFGPLMGALYAWVSTLCSASTNFLLARSLGQKKLARFTGPRLSAVLEKVEKNGLLWSFVVRLVPTGPFILVNLAAGLSGIRLHAFILGTALGIMPKIAIMALIAKGMFAGIDGRLMSLAFIALAIIAILFTFWVQKRLLPSSTKS